MELTKFRLRRFLPSDVFLAAVREIKVFGGSYVSKDELELLERLSLLFPKIRLHFADGVGRRLWLEESSSQTHLQGNVEPDGDRWDAAVALRNGLFRWQNRRIGDTSSHPFDDYVEQRSEFLAIPEASTHRPWKEFCVDVSSDPKCLRLSSTNFESYYAPWQVLVAAEVAQMGVFYPCNLVDPEKFEEAWRLTDQEIQPGKRATFYFQGRGAICTLTANERSLDAIVWSVEEIDHALLKYIPSGGGRYRVQGEQFTKFESERAVIARDAVNKFHVKYDELIVLVRFLIERWDYWTNEGRPLSADAYKIFAAAGVRLIQLSFNSSIAELEQAIGSDFRRIWPDWATEQRRRLILTLREALRGLNVQEAEVERFAEFLIDERLESFFWRLKSFEDQVFRGNEFSFRGMRSELQGFALTVEHVVRALGGSKGQLDEMFQELWKDPEVLAILKEKAHTARTNVNAKPWDVFRLEMDEVRRRGMAGIIAADLITARRLRGAVHYSLPLDDNDEIEQLFIGLMRAALFTFLEARRED